MYNHCTRTKNVQHNILQLGMYKNECCVKVSGNPCKLYIRQHHKLFLGNNNKLESTKTPPYNQNFDSFQ